jgi:hypothetical protein
MLILFISKKGLLSLNKPCLDNISDRDIVGGTLPSRTTTLLHNRQDRPFWLDPADKSALFDKPASLEKKV